MADDIDGAGEAADLLAMAPLMAIDALPEVDRRRVLRLLAATDDHTRDEFAAEVAAARESMAQLSDLTATPPPAGLRDTVLRHAEQDDAQGAARDGGSTGRSRWRWAAAAAAVAVVVGIGGGLVGYAVSDRPGEPGQSTSDKVFAAPDVRTVSGPVATGQASVTYSSTERAGVLVMNDVPPPEQGTVYQLWLVGPDGPRLGGVMTPNDVGTSTTAVVDDLGDATSVAFTVGDADEPERMISEPIAELPLRP
ncbi:anti-sigma factor [Gordonia caeni]|uniref:Regulator of SigK n=1 Tax=Gordonia caeni TaxID=1007097 RepID=A0ABP7NR40_9ACTN